ncbi:MAG: HlyD family secretion protein [Chromatiaceae bacterium]|nr:HlyD family secretion protein [Chromatiaceae bacterium]
MQLRRVMLAIGILAIGGAAAWYYDTYLRAHPSTADAYLGMHVVQIAPQVSGTVETVQVRSHQAVRRGDVLFELDARPFRLAANEADARLQQARDTLAAADAQVTAAQAQVDAAEAALHEVERHSARVGDLVAKGTASKDEGDTAQRALKSAHDNVATANAELTAAIARRGGRGEANAAIRAAEATLGQAKLDLQHTRILAPADGIVGDLTVRPGSFVNAGRPLFALVESDEVWVDANFKETDLVRIQPGQSASVTVDLLPGKTFEATVESLSPASGTAFSLLPPENATGNWVKVTQRFPVRLRILDPVAGLRLGGSSHVTIAADGPAG